jgi:hypothetical protein
MIMIEKQKPYDVFISYATEDEAYAEKVANSLKSLGFKIWFAPATLKVGDSLLSSINAGLSASKYGLLILSAEYMSKSWTEYELNVLHRQYIESDKKLFPLWHDVDKNQIDKWNPAFSGIVALKSSMKLSLITEKIANVISQNAPIRGVTPSYENPQWRFLQGRGELLANSDTGGAFNIFEAAEFPDKDFPLYIYGRLYSKKDIIIEIAKIIVYQSYNLSSERRDRMVRLCKDYGFDTEDPNFDPAFID